MLAKLLVHFYFFVHGTLGLPGAGWLLRRLVPIVPGLRSFPLAIPEIGTVILDFRDETSFGILNMRLGDYGDNAKLFRLMERLLGPGKVLWDIGANVGFMCIYFSHPRHQLRAIHAFEPTPVALKPLQSLFHDHPLVHVHPIGLGDCDQKIQMTMSAGSSSLSSLVRSLEGGEQITVPIRRGDSYRAEQKLAPPDLIKIDVEGYEPAVLAGLAETIREFRPTILFEHGLLKEQAVRALVPPQYCLFFILNENALTADFSRRMETGDALLVPAARAGEIAQFLV
jgi:FkbM family methyltransferase